MTLERIKQMVADLSRPYAVIITSTGAAVSMVIVAIRAPGDFTAAGVFIGAVGVLVTGIYASKSIENATTAKHDAAVKIAEAGKTMTDPQPVTVVNPPSDPVPVTAADEPKP